MGDRGNIVLRYTRYGTDDTSDIYLYSHWGGSELPTTLADALDSKIGRNRWHDDSYLARIIFDRLTAGDQGEETGFGIAPWIGDNEHPLLFVDLDKKTVTVGEGGQVRCFEEFIRAARAQELGSDWREEDEE
jgi:hypothetical protein